MDYGEVNFNEKAMQEYADLLMSSFEKMRSLCDELEKAALISSKCIDSENGAKASQNLLNNVEKIKHLLPDVQNSEGKLQLALKKIRDLHQHF